ncbi:hypothetical protein KKC1_24230 [Calderihabitans maritimus]|uniref:Uncharacterized protein n=1 Tax=Calderihabitans maritimus TaxID=1246530 RepID=A0A1Z5HUS1_9FIRM|nr:hypothetical protein KKC1_24230 [Calderihabitans maritimus]
MPITRAQVLEQAPDAVVRDYYYLTAYSNELPGLNAGPLKAGVQKKGGLSPDHPIQVQNRPRLEKLRAHPKRVHSQISL